MSQCEASSCEKASTGLVHGAGYCKEHLQSLQERADQLARAFSAPALPIDLETEKMVDALMNKKIGRPMTLCETDGCEKVGTWFLADSMLIGADARGRSLCDGHYAERFPAGRKAAHGEEVYVRNLREDYVGLDAKPCPEDTVARFGLNKISMRADNHQVALRDMAMRMTDVWAYIEGTDVKVRRLRSGLESHRTALFALLAAWVSMVVVRLLGWF